MPSRNGKNASDAITEAGVLGLYRRDARAVDARHLPGADADGHVVTRIDDRVRLDELGDLPGEYQVLHLLRIGLYLAHHVEALVEGLVGLLDQ